MTNCTFLPLDFNYITEELFERARLMEEEEGHTGRVTHRKWQVTAYQRC